jgi:hypothetical protein
MDVALPYNKNQGKKEQETARGYDVAHKTSMWIYDDQQTPTFLDALQSDLYVVGGTRNPHAPE